LPAIAAGIADEWPIVRQICRLHRSQQIEKNGQWQEAQETVYLITSLSSACTSPQAILQNNRDHWGIEIMHRNKDVFLGEDGYTNRNDNAPANIFSLTSLVLAILKTVSASPTLAIEYFQNDKTVPFASSQVFLNRPVLSRRRRADLPVCQLIIRALAIAP
jgi:hypothetical protein